MDCALLTQESGWTDGRMDAFVDGLTDGWIDGSMNEWMDGWVNVDASVFAHVAVNPVV